MDLLIEFEVSSTLVDLAGPDFVKRHGREGDGATPNPKSLRPELRDQVFSELYCLSFSGHETLDAAARLLRPIVRSLDAIHISAAVLLEGD